MTSRLRRWLLGAIFTASLASVPEAPLAEQGLTSDQAAFIAAARRDFEILSTKLPEARKSHWRSEDWRRTNERSQWIQQWQAGEEWVQRHPKRRELEAIRPFQYLKEFGEQQLRDVTQLTEGLGREVREAFLRERVDPRLAEFDTKLSALRGKISTAQLVAPVTEAFGIKATISALRTNPPVRLRLVYAPKSSAFDETPQVVGEYILHDWSASMTTAEAIEARLGNLSREIAVQEYLAPRDPNAAVALVLQLALLLIAVAGYIINYTRRPSLTVITSMVLIGMAASVLLVFWSGNTLANVLTQSLVPGIFILWWVWWKRDEHERSGAPVKAVVEDGEHSAPRGSHE